MYVHVCRFVNYLSLLILSIFNVTFLMPAYLSCTYCALQALFIYYYLLLARVWYTVLLCNCTRIVDAQHE